MDIEGRLATSSRQFVWPTTPIGPFLGKISRKNWGASQFAHGDLRITGGSDAETTLYPGGAQRTTLRSHPPLPPCSRGLPKTIGPFFNRGFCIFLFLVKEYREAGRGAASGTAAAGSALVLLPISAHRDNEQRPAARLEIKDTRSTIRTILGPTLVGQGSSSIFHAEPPNLDSKAADR